MLLLRWMIGIGCVLALALFALIMTVGKGLASVYRSGTGTEDIVRKALPLGIAALLCLMLASVISPHARWLAHVTAAGVSLALAGVLWSAARTHPGEALIYTGFLALWGLWYALTWRGGL